METSHSTFISALYLHTAILFNTGDSTHLKYIIWKIVSLFIIGKVSLSLTLNRNKNTFSSLLVKCSLQ